jgi:glutaredoxin
MTVAIPIVYALESCPACAALRQAWTAESIAFEERRVDEKQEWMNEARKYGDVVPIIVYPDGRVDNTGRFGGKFG